MSVRKLEEISKVLEVSVEQILSFDEQQIFNIHFNEGSNNDGNASAYMVLNNSFEAERKLFERMIEDKDREIERLMRLLKLNE
ncbi:MAG: hypothetical protein ACI8ZN_000527 [Bacteroidia bacterium]